MSLARAVSLSVAVLALAQGALTQGALAQGAPATKFTIKVENISNGEVLKLSNGKTAPFVSAPVLWAVHTGSTNPIFVAGQADAGKGLETLAETGNPAPLAKSLNGATGVVAVGADDRPVGSDAGGPIPPGKGYQFEVTAAPGQTLSLATRDRDGAKVVLKTLVKGSGGLGTLGREFELIRSLDLEGVPRAIELVTVGDQEILLLEDAGRMRLKALIPASGMDLGTFLPARDPARRDRARPASPEAHPQGHQSQQHPGRSGDRSTGADRFQHRLSDARRTPGPAPPERARGNDRVPVARADRQDEPGHRLPYRLLFPGRDVLRDADRAPPVRVRRSTRGDSRPHRENASLPAGRRPAIPLPLSDMVMKLLAKAAEERYQSAAGLKADLSRWKTEWEAGADAQPRGVGPERRRRSLPASPAALRARAAARAAAGSVRAGRAQGRASSCWSPAMPVSARRSLIRELYRPLGGPAWVFHRREVRPGRQGTVWRTAPGLPGADPADPHGGRASRWPPGGPADRGAGPGASVLAEVVPEVASLLGPQPPAPALGATETQNRFRLVIQNFFGPWPGGSIRSSSFWMTCNGPTARRSICWSRCSPTARSRRCC